jgi:hypothetical protein
VTRTELEQLVAAIQRRGDPKYTTPSGAFLEYISTLAVQLDITALAEACGAYASAFPESAAFIAARVPGILCNRYFTVLPEFNYDRFIQWSLKTPDWAAAIKAGFSSPSELTAAIASIRQELGRSA